MRVDNNPGFVMYPGRPVTSKDPRKKGLLSAFKQETGCAKVTTLYELRDGSGFQAHCLKSIGRKQYESIGFYRISIEPRQA